MNEKQPPLVSCIMPTYNRRAFIPHAINYFLSQDYPNKELIVIDDGTDSIRDLVPAIKTIRYFRPDQKITLGAKLNLACKHARGAIIANWDDDDWYAPRRLTYQVSTLQNEATSVCGINNLLYYDLRSRQAYQYIYPADQPVWLLGSSLCYTKEFWNYNRFAEINVGMDGLFVWGTTANKISVLPDQTIAVHMIHDSNASPKKTEGIWWHTYPVEDVKKIIQSDWGFYSNGIFAPAAKDIYISEKPVADPPLKQDRFKNVYACLVHENEDAIIDLVRNLHYHDDQSVILLYNGGHDPGLFKTAFPFEKFSVIIYPQPVHVTHGYLHEFALHCMQFALDNLSFDSITVVDSDQLALRSGYSEYMGNFLLGKSNIGMLSSFPERVTPEHKDDKVWPALQAFKEYDLWKPFLHKFPDGESKFVHWTFWPSTVFTAAAARDLTKLFKQNTQLQQIMKQSKLWATEEVILPTLVSLLGYDILLNPCSYDFVKYQKTFGLQELDKALHKKDAYWIHPVERKYDNELRNYTRRHFNHYAKKKNDEASTKNLHMLTTFSLINKIKNIEGWLEDKEADLLIAVTLKAIKRSPLNPVVEIGSYHGKSTVLFGSIVKEYAAGVKVYAIDPHEGTVGAADQGLHTLPPSLEMFNRNIADAGLENVVELIKDCSFNVTWEQPVSLLFIDGLHDYPNVARDFWHFSNWVVAGGYIAFHDYSDYYPGVVAFVDELLTTGEYGKIDRAGSLVVVQKL